MQITVLADESGQVIGAMLHVTRPSAPEDPQGIQIAPDEAEGEVAVTVDVPEELADRIPNAKYFEALQRYVVKDGSLVKRR